VPREQVYSWGVVMSKGTQTRERIIAKAATLFNQKGFDGCSMQDIGAATGLEKGTLYGHFHSKEELSLAAFDHAWGETVRDRLEGVEALPGVIDRLLLHVRNFTTHTPLPGGCPLMNTIIDADDGNQALLGKANQALVGWRAYLQRELREGQKRGELKAEFDPDSVTAVLMSLLEGAMALERIDAAGRYLEKAAEHMAITLKQLVPAAEDRSVVQN